jgi:hypothetical protein
MPTLIAFGLPRLTLFCRDFQATPLPEQVVLLRGNTTANIGWVPDTSNIWL